MPPYGPRHMRSEIGMVLRGESHTHRVLRSRLAILLGATLVLDVAGTLLMYLFEHDHRGSGFDDLGGALFWVSAQLTTVSSQMPNPVTTAGRVLDIVLEVWAISVVATLAASLAAFLRARHVEHRLASDRGPGRQPAHSPGSRLVSRPCPKAKRRLRPGRDRGRWRGGAGGAARPARARRRPRRGDPRLTGGSVRRSAPDRGGAVRAGIGSAPFPAGDHRGARRRVRPRDRRGGGCLRASGQLRRRGETSGSTP